MDKNIAAFIIKNFPRRQLYTTCRFPPLLQGRQNGDVIVTSLTTHQCHTTAAANTTGTLEIKPFEDIPGPKFRNKLTCILYQVWNMYKYRGRNHIAFQDGIDKFGSISKIRIPGIMDIVYLSDVEGVEKLHRYDGRTPERLVLAPWKKWREENGHALGILISSGEEWKRMRAPLDKLMLRPQVVHTYTDDFNEVITDFINHIRHVRAEDGAVKELNQELFRWSLEAIGKVLYGTRFGNFTQKGADEEIHRFIESVHDMFVSTGKVSNYPPPIVKLFFRKWLKMHENAWDCMFKTGKRLIDKKLVEIKKAVEEGTEVSGFLPALLASDNLEIEEIYANISELMIAAVDTTSSTMHMALYYLTRNPEVLQKLQDEVRTITPKGQIPTKEDVTKMPYLKAVIKEVLRLVPVAGVITRTTTKDIDLCGYHIPPGTTVLGLTYSMGRDPKNYTNPEAFQPERWLRAESKHTHTFAWLPFGHGPRMCIGKRVAELEMHLLLARLVQEFDMETGQNEDVYLLYEGLLQTNKAVNVKFIDSK